MDFELSEDQELMRRSLREFLEKECPKEYLDRHDEEGEFAHEVFQKLAELGWMGVYIPEEYGGAGGSIIDSLILAEEVGRVSPAIAIAYGYWPIAITAILKQGEEEQKRRYLPALARGEMFVAALSEPDAGSDAVSVATTARPEGDYYIIDGSKTFVTGGNDAAYLSVIARTDKSVPKRDGLTLFVVPAETEGVERRRLEELGFRATGMSEIFFTGVKVPKDSMLGSLNKGWQALQSFWNAERLCAAAQALGGAEGAFDIALQYAKERVQFGRPIGKFQVIAHMLADMAVDIEAARVLIYYAAWKESQGIECPMDCSMAKVYATDTFMKVATDGIQILGGYGCTMDYPMQRYFRDAKGYQIAGGTTQIQRNLIARQMGL